MPVTQSELAKHLGISQRSISVAFGGEGRISEKTRKRIVNTADELGYRPNRLASSLRKGRTGSVGVVWAFVNPWTGDSEIGIDVLRRLQDRGLVTYQAHHADDKDVALLCRHLDELIGRRVDALVLQGTPGELMHPAVLERLREVPSVAVCRKDLPEFPGDLVIHDRNNAIGEVVDHLVGTGRKKIAMAVALAHESNPPKVKAFLDRCRFHGIAPHAHEVIDLDVFAPGVTQGDRHRNAMLREFPGSVDVDAIFCFNDVGAMYVMRDLKRRGLRVPDDVAVVGFNDTEAASVWEPPLASGDRRYSRVAQNVDELLAEQMAHPEGDRRRRIVHMAFIHRSSAGGDRLVSGKP